MYTESRKTQAGWLIVFSAAILFLFFYAGEMLLPLSAIGNYSNHITRIWLWTEYSILIAATAFIVRYGIQELSLRVFITGILLSGINAVSMYSRNGLNFALQEFVIVFITYIAAATIFRQNLQLKISAFTDGFWQTGRSLLRGAFISLPFAALNVYFYNATQGPMQLQNPLLSGLHALNPAISEEIVFRFMVFAVFSALLTGRLRERWLVVICYSMAVIPHSLIHLPDLFRDAPVNALMLFVLTSLIFGLPMAYLQKRFNLETAIGFHWLIDFTRALCGFF